MWLILGQPESPMSIAVLAKSHNSITVSWKAGLNGGSEQHFKVLYRKKGQKNYQESLDSITGLETGQTINNTIYGLDANTQYEIAVAAINTFTINQSHSAKLTVTTEGKI